MKGKFAVKRGNVLDLIIMAVLGAIFGLLLKLLPAGTSDFIDKNILTVISSMIITALKMLVVPMVFFTIAGSVAKMDDLVVFGKIGVKIFIVYAITSVLAVCLAFFYYSIVPLGNSLVATPFVEDEVVAQTFSLRDTIVNIVPGNFFGAFTAGNMLQILFIAIIIGIAAMRMKDNTGVRRFLESANALFVEAIRIVIDFISIAMFCTMATMIYTIGAESVAYMAGLALEI